MRRLRRNYSNMWIQSTRANRELDQTQLLEKLDIESDLTTTTSEYVSTIIDGMISLLEKDLKRSDLVQNEKFFEKLMDLGKSVMNGSKESKDLFTLGMLIESKIRKNFMSLRFYKLIAQSIAYINKNIEIFTESFQRRLREDLRRHRYQTNSEHFYHYKECS